MFSNFGQPVSVNEIGRIPWQERIASEEQRWRGTARRLRRLRIELSRQGPVLSFVIDRVGMLCIDVGILSLLGRFRYVPNLYEEIPSS